MKPRKKSKRRILISEEDGVLQALYDVRHGTSRVAVRDYVDRYITLKVRALRLQKKGLKVRIVLPDFPRRPMLIIGK
jgi:hypothetical protein